MTKDINKLQMLSPFPTYVEGVGHFISPTIKQILELGYETYGFYISVLRLTPEKYFALTGQMCVFEKLSSQEKLSLSMFDIWMEDQHSLNLLLEVLSFFSVDKIISNDEFLIFSSADGDQVYGTINKENFHDVCNVILKLNFTPDSQSNEGKPKNDEAKYILEKLKKGSALLNKHSGKDLSLDTIISAMCVQHNSYNMTNIWSLTIYQLYDQFFRQNAKIQLDASYMRWAAYGTEQFDFSDWLKSNKN